MLILEDEKAEYQLANLSWPRSAEGDAPAEKAQVDGPDEVDLSRAFKEMKAWL